MPAPGAPTPSWSIPPAPRKRTGAFEIVVSVIGAFAIGLSILGYLGLAGCTTTLHVAVYALVPLMIVISVLARIDRWEPEPFWTKATAFIWGAGLAVVFSSVVNTVFLFSAEAALADADTAMRFTTVAVAPIVEESAKGLGVLLIVLMRRETIHSVLDGAVYAGFAGAGFAFIENMQYFIAASQESMTSLTVTFILRGAFSPFVHPMATSITGMALAWALLHAGTALGRLAVSASGWLGAVLLHALWNLLAGLPTSEWFLAYLMIEVPLFTAWIALLLRLSRLDARSIRIGLGPYARTGWILPGEIDLVTDEAAKKAARAWAKAGGPRATRALEEFLVALAALGLDTAIMNRRGPQTARIAKDRELLASAALKRAEFLALVAGGGTR